MDDLDLGRTVDRYTVEGLLGRGGMGVVYRVRHTVLGSEHALKVLWIGSRALRDRLVQEGRVQARLRHTNIVAVTDVIDIDGAPGLVMDYIDGPNLEHWLTKPHSAAEVDTIARGLLSGVAAAHAVGLVHRDLKPANVLIAAGTVPKVADFGLAKLLGEDVGPSATRTGSAMGTPKYMAPEQVRDAKSVDARADVFALGAILYEMVTGRGAFEGEDIAEVLMAVRDAKYVPIDIAAPGLSPTHKATIARCLSVRPADRFANAAELLAAWTGDAALASAYEAAPLRLPASNETMLPPEEDPFAPTLSIAPPVAAPAVAPIAAQGGWVAAPELPPKNPSIPEGWAGRSIVPEPLPGLQIEAPLEAVAAEAPPLDPTWMGEARPQAAGPPPTMAKGWDIPFRSMFLGCVGLIGLAGGIGGAALFIAYTRPVPTPPPLASPVRVGAPAEEVVEEAAPVGRPAAPRGQLRVTSEPVAEVFVDGRDLGDTREGPWTLPIGDHTVVLRPFGSTRSMTLTVIVPEGGLAEVCWSFETDGYCKAAP